MKYAGRKVDNRRRKWHPKGFKPGWWRCPECGEYWHDSWQRRTEATAWDLPAECDCSDRMIEMERSGPPPDMEPA